MSKWTVLEARIREAAKQLQDLKNQRQKILADLELYQSESQKVHKLQQENRDLKEERKRVLERVEKLHGKLAELTL